VFDLVLAYGAGLLTLINPCVLAVLPLVLGAAVRGGRSGPLVLAAGMSISFVAVGMLVLTAGASLGLNEDIVSQIGAVLMIGFGVGFGNTVNTRLAWLTDRIAFLMQDWLGKLLAG